MSRKLFLGALAALVLISGTETAHAVWNQPKFAIGGYIIGGDPTSIQRLNDAGIDYVVPGDHPSPTTARQIAARIDSMRAAIGASFRLQDIVYDESNGSSGGSSVPNPASLFKNFNPVSYKTSILNEITTGLNNASVAGWMIWDEPPLVYLMPGDPPAAQVYNNIHEMTKLVRDSTNGANTSNKLAMTNLLQISRTAYPFYVDSSGCDPDTVKGYLCYLDKFLAPFASGGLPAPVLSFDAYPFSHPDSGFFRPYFVNLAAVRDKALQYGTANYRIPFWSVMQAAPHRPTYTSPYARFPTFNQIRWQAYVSLAYGAKGIFYWTLRPHDPNGPAGDGYGNAFLKRDGSKNGALYDSLTALNAELKGLGPRLMTLDPVVCYHVAKNRFLLPTDEDTLANPHKVYNIVSSITGTNNQGMMGYFKQRSTGDDYLLIVNKDTTVTQSFTVTLGAMADTVYRQKKSDGSLIKLGTNTTSFVTGPISPGGGELFKIADQTYEYLPNVNVTAIVGDTVWYGTDRGIVMVIRNAGKRFHHIDAGIAYTPCVDLSVTKDHLFVAQDNGTNGNIARLNRDFSGHTTFYLGNPRVRAVTAQWAESSIVVVDRLSTTTSNVKVLSSAGAVLQTFPFNDAGAPSTPWIAYDVQYQPGLGSFVVAHGRYYSRYLAKSPWTLLQQATYRTPAPTSVRLTALGTGISQLLFAGRNEGTIGGIEKMDYKLARPNPNGWWPAGGTEPSVKDVMAAGNHVLFCSTSPGGDFFVRLRALDLWALGYRSTTLPRAVGLSADSVALMANGAGVARSSQSGLAGRFRMRPDAGRTVARADSLESSIPTELSFRAQPNPTFGKTMIRFGLPQGGRVIVEAFDVQGRRVARLLNAEMVPGMHSLSWKPSTRGVYFLRLKSPMGELTSQVVVR